MGDYALGLAYVNGGLGVIGGLHGSDGVLVQLGKHPPSVSPRAPDVKVSREESLAAALPASARPTASVPHPASAPACRRGTSRPACAPSATPRPTGAEAPGPGRRSAPHAGGRPSRPGPGHRAPRAPALAGGRGAVGRRGRAGGRPDPPDHAGGHRGGAPHMRQDRL